MALLAAPLLVAAGLCLYVRWGLRRALQAIEDAPDPTPSARLRIVDVLFPEEPPTWHVQK